MGSISKYQLCILTDEEAEAPRGWAWPRAYQRDWRMWNSKPGQWPGLPDFKTNPRKGDSCKRKEFSILAGPNAAEKPREVRIKTEVFQMRSRFR